MRERLESFGSYSWERDFSGQYWREIRNLESAGLTRRGYITDPHGNLRPVPSEQAVKKVFEDKGYRGAIEQKYLQKFTKLRLVPRVPLEAVTEACGWVIQRHRRTGTLLDSHGKPIVKQPRNGQDLLVAPEYRNAATELKYFSQRFSIPDQGTLKKDLGGGAVDIILMEDLRNIPIRGTGRKHNNRRPLETEETAERSLETLQNDSRYQYESGLTPEVALDDFISCLEETNRISYDETDAFLLGAYSPREGKVSSFTWHSEESQGILDFANPWKKSPDAGARSMVNLNDIYSDAGIAA